MKTLALVALLSGCATVQKIDQATLNCEEQTVAPKLAGDIPAAISDLTSNDQAALDQLLVTDGIDVAYCAVQAAVRVLENGGAAGPMPMAMGPDSAAPKAVQNIPAIARGEAWLAVHRK